MDMIIAYLMGGAIGFFAGMVLALLTAMSIYKHSASGQESGKDPCEDDSESGKTIG